jgi:hypothetical protein
MCRKGAAESCTAQAMMGCTTPACLLQPACCAWAGAFHKTNIWTRTQELGIAGADGVQLRHYMTAPQPGAGHPPRRCRPPPQPATWRGLPGRTRSWLGRRGSRSAARAFGCRPRSCFGSTGTPPPGRGSAPRGSASRWRAPRRWPPPPAPPHHRRSATQRLLRSASGVSVGRPRDMHRRNAPHPCCSS